MSITFAKFEQIWNTFEHLKSFSNYLSHLKFEPMLITFAKFEQTSKMLAIFDYKLFLDLLSLSDFCKSFDATASTCVRLT